MFEGGYQNLHELLEDHPVGDARPVAAWRTIHLRFWKQDGELLPERLLLDVWWERGHGFSPSSGSLVTPQMIERPAPAFQVDVLCPYPRKLLGQNRRMSKDYERLCARAEAFVYAAMIRLMVRRLARG